MAIISTQPIGQSDAFMAILDRVSDLAVIEKPILIAGESGTGKELIASRLHFLSPRWEQVFVSVNCAAYTEAELDIVLFGGAASDGRGQTDGRFHDANRGTLFLDNVQAVSLRLQEKLIRAIEYGHYQMRGEIPADNADVRILAASHIDLQAAARSGLFRTELLYSLAFDVLTLPPLRTRLDDILPLSEHFGKKIAAELGAGHFPGLSAEAVEILQAYRWPGNVRELKYVIERSVARAWLVDESLTMPISEFIFDPFDHPDRLNSASPIEMTKLSLGDMPVDQTASTDNTIASKASQHAPFAERIMTFERRLIDEALSASSQHQGRAAEYMGLSYHQLRGLLRKHGLKK